MTVLDDFKLEKKEKNEAKMIEHQQERDISEQGPSCQRAHIECHTDSMSIEDFNRMNMKDPALLLTTSSIIISDRSMDHEHLSKHYLSLPCQSNSKLQLNETIETVQSKTSEHALKDQRTLKTNLSGGFRSLNWSSKKLFVLVSKSKSLPVSLVNQEIPAETQVNSTPIPLVKPVTRLSGNLNEQSAIITNTSPIQEGQVNNYTSPEEPLATSWQTISITGSSTEHSTESLSMEVDAMQQTEQQASPTPQVTVTSVEIPQFDLKPKQKCKSYTALFDNSALYATTNCDNPLASDPNCKTYSNDGDREFFEDIGKGS
jgi:hypothetical protein